MIAFDLLGSATMLPSFEQEEREEREVEMRFKAGRTPADGRRLEGELRSKMQTPHDHEVFAFPISTLPRTAQARFGQPVVTSSVLKSQRKNSDQ